MLVSIPFSVAEGALKLTQTHPEDDKNKDHGLKTSIFLFLYYIFYSFVSFQGFWFFFFCKPVL